jgi:hypothetical protein
VASKGTVLSVAELLKIAEAEEPVSAIPAATGEPRRGGVGAQVFADQPLPPAL